MSKRIVVDPITRIEGHLRVEVMVDDNNVVTDAFSSSTLWRGLETIVKGRDPRDAGFLMQRICGVCTFSHYKAGIMAVENALGITPPLNAVLTRTLMNNALFFHDHIVHFYQLHALDFVDIVSALSADPFKAQDEAFKYTDFPYACGADHLKAVQAKVKTFVDKGNLGPFANAYYGHKTYHLTPEQNLIALSHYLECLRVQRTAAQMMAIFGAKQPHPQSLTVGGVTCVMDILSPARLGEYMTKFNEVKDFVDRAYYPDLVMAGKAYANEPSVLNDVGVANLWTHQEFQLSQNEWLFESGIIKNGDLSKVEELDESKITEEATHSWYKNDKPLHPYDGEQEPNYTGFKDEKTLNAKGEMVNTKVLDTSGKYSWIKAPRYGGKPMQVGPLANIVVNYAKGNKYVVPVVDKFLADTGLPLTAVLSTLGRTACRMIEAKVIADNGLIALNNLIANIKSGDTETCAKYTIDTSKEYKGRYIGHVPRGTLSHWCRIEKGVIKNWQAVVPSTWNASPKDANGGMGSYEACLIGLKIADLTQPLEIIRKIHSYDPCIACAVHVMDTKGNEISEYKVNPSL
ncbi:quinone-reactive Ni/Fe-hydrogenase large chain [Campylobacter sputorum subsp. bubulus]|uniref:Quinone-reactive Ni/Fe-hydrogenase large chain n=1 Tax=Campylobacter sputorum subsp. sputorum TaxID=32024 RepID=A0A381DIL2_9BACT|nr:nickel-dependent hydrogenase large subunit [Campylobacter sputorum]ASM35355.1 [NiFe] hydrogenase, large subunit [Campylobacter sputorum aubsp. sputorum RM3237]KAB0582900.1 nickel-dependent hydrogenase large subunit [Campylobacter sputorum subsp. sputorum]QEL05547.1 [Ni-Fe] hydrogenase, large subunit [Campylobacter sputorum subsp. sputorum]SUX08633.1 quinone-reactive Ni/Fe-hydrogenase large chain [Campylobacter sputorum subsp. bubulus]SUX10311.1 quinone-reactive Ni/Fe-hydrogenase large chain